MGRAAYARSRHWVRTPSTHPSVLIRVLWCGYNLMVKSWIVIPLIWVQFPVVTPKSFYVRVTRKAREQIATLFYVGSNPITYSNFESNK